MYIKTWMYKPLESDLHTCYIVYMCIARVKPPNTRGSLIGKKTKGNCLRKKSMFSSRPFGMLTPLSLVSFFFSLSFSLSLCLSVSLQFYSLFLFQFDFSIVFILPLPLLQSAYLGTYLGRHNFCRQNHLIMATTEVPEHPGGPQWRSGLP